MNESMHQLCERRIVPLSQKFRKLPGAVAVLFILKGVINVHS